MSILQNDLVPSYPILTVDHPLVKARVALHGAHLLEWTPAGHQPVLYLSPEAIYRNGKAVRGGIPICWPWFGPHPTQPELPAHGLARTRAWELAGAEEDADGVTLRFNLMDDDETRKLWPGAFALELTMRLGRKLEMSLLMENHADHPVTISSALHTYLAVGDIRQVFLTGLEGANYLDEVGPPTERTQAGEIRFASEVDRIYADAPEVTVHDPQFERRLRITPKGSGSTVVWNPWIEKSRKLTDLPDEDYQRFVCVETTNAWQDLVKMEPGDCHTLGMTLEVFGKLPWDTLSDLHQRSGDFKLEGNFSAMIPLRQEITRLLEVHGAEADRIASSWNYQAYVHLHAGNLEAAEKAARYSITYYLKHGHPLKDESLATYKALLSTILERQNRLNEALVELDEAVLLFRTFHGEDSFVTARKAGADALRKRIQN